MAAISIALAVLKPLVTLAVHKFAGQKGKGAAKKQFVADITLSVLDRLQNAGEITDTEAAEAKAGIGGAIDQTLAELESAGEIAPSDSSTIRVYNPACVEIRMK